MTTDTNKQADEFKPVRMKPWEFYVECPCCLDECVLGRFDDHADTYAPSDEERFIKCDNCGQDIEVLGVEVVDISSTPQPQIDVELRTLKNLLITYQETLEFYADEKNWVGQWHHECNQPVSSVDFDEGKRARQVLIAPPHPKDDE